MRPISGIEVPTALEDTYGLLDGHERRTPLVEQMISNLDGGTQTDGLCGMHPAETGPTMHKNDRSNGFQFRSRFFVFW